MSDSLLALRRRIVTARDLAGVVRTMKALAASRIAQFEAAVTALRQYSSSIERGLALALKPVYGSRPASHGQQPLYLVAYGSDQGLVGQFNDLLADHISAVSVRLPAPPQIIAVGERLADQLHARQLPIARCYPVPTGSDGIAGLGNRILIEETAMTETPDRVSIMVGHNQISGGSRYQPATKVVLPLDRAWEQHLSGYRWPTGQLPELYGSPADTTRALLAEYLFISLFRACAESLASENLCRLTAMQRAEKNISEQLEELGKRFHQQRQDAIDAELFDVLAGFEQASR